MSQAPTAARKAQELRTSLAGGPQTVARAFLDSLRQHAGRDAIKPPGMPARTYAELGEDVRVAVAVMQRLGLAAGTRAAICLPNGYDWAVLTYAAAMLGVCLVPLNIRYRADELVSALQRSAATVLFTQDRFLSNDFLARLREIAGDRELGQGTRASIEALPDLHDIVLMQGAAMAGTQHYAAISRDADASRVDLEAFAARRQPQDPMWLFWTSGTTSAPKGALLPQSAVDMAWRWSTLAGYRPQDRILMTRPLFYIAGHFWCLLAPMLHGALSVVGDRFTAEEMIVRCRDEAVTILSGNPLMLKALVQDPSFEPEAFRSVRLGYFGGSTLSLEEMRQIRDRIGIARMIHTYGMTEYGGFVLSTLPDDSIEQACASCGYPFTEVEIKLVDPASGEPTPRGQVGMVMTRGHKLLDYLDLPAQEKSRLFDEQEWFRSGDLMRETEEGRYEFIGRAKDLIKVGGENVTAAEVETLLMRHPHINIAAVLGEPDANKGEVVVAYVEVGPQAGGLDAAGIQAWCRQKMAPHKVPARIHLVAPAVWPMTSSGKIAKHLLASLAIREHTV
ncbi:class I adenylate-forming enzyme family protein [Bordetella sp. BOR01]|uniref:class I adenylate-forming enzyme family protein n=1 Tax=Bordetella sp. BOR01 TaxID=2854779 RepID=UPI001C477BDF|nr:class I adenylate-forming enzyme family protein [Bordetella sp. BOR01]MBV7482110.1 acyl--CoA ligase [Bordetella sp. BOR01]